LLSLDNGMYDPIWDIDKELEVLNAQKVSNLVKSLAIMTCWRYYFFLTDSYLIIDLRDGKLVFMLMELVEVSLLRSKK
jgi:hypothetical protein